MNLRTFLVVLVVLLKVSNVKAQYDTDASTFFSYATGLTDVQKNAINHLVLDIKGVSGLWDKMKAIYPFVGGTAATHQYNLRTPTVYNLTFSGGITHSATGALPDGSTGFANTHLSGTSLPQNSAAFSFYSNTNTSVGGRDIGINYSGYNYMEIRQGDNTVFGINGSNYGITNGLTTDGRGLFTLSRTEHNVTKLYQDGTNKATVSVESMERDALDYFLFATNQGGGTPGGFSNRECRFAAISEGLTDAEATSLSTIVHTYLENLAATASCTYTITPSSIAPSSAAGTGSIAVSSSTGCSWTATSNNTDWITVTSGSTGTANGTVNYSYTANTSTSARTGTVTVAGQTFTITQAGTTGSSDATWIATGNNIYNANSGSVGIGTGNLHMGDDGFKLFVAKGIRTEKIKVDVPYTTWPDYVFNKNYKLPSLAETEKFIKLNNHLPGIPSASEMEKGGLDVGAHQSLLLQKIEELTLLLIKQNKTQEQLKKIIRKQNARITKLEKKK